MIDLLLGLLENRFWSLSLISGLYIEPAIFILPADLRSPLQGQFGTATFTDAHLLHSLPLISWAVTA